jgi:enoyl-CoA hydratase/carnithine racemase
MTELTSPKEALVMGLLLALTAPTDELAQEASAMADQLAANMSTEEVEACKSIALARYQATK